MWIVLNDRRKDCVFTHHLCVFVTYSLRARLRIEGSRGGKMHGNLSSISSPSKELSMSTTRTPLHRLQVDANLARFIDTEVLPGTGVAPDAF